MDSTDKKILDVLSENSRISFKDLSKKLRISDVAVKKRTDKLVKSGVIKKFTLEIDNSKVGKSVTSLVLIKSEAGKTKEIASALRELGDVYTTLGEYEIILKLNSEGIDELRKIVENKISLLNGVIEVKTNIVVSAF